MVNDQAPAVVVDGLRVIRGTREVLPGISPNAIARSSVGIKN